MPAANQRLGEYILLDRIAVGAFGEVWRARHHAWSDQIVAVKIPTDPQFVRNLQKEGFAIQRLSHPCIVRPISFDPYAAPAYLVTEYIPGCSLRQFIQQGPMKIEDVAAVMKQVLAALHQAHHSGVIHRDIKPENILIHERATTSGFSAKGVVKVTDFGLGKTAIHNEQSIVFSEDQRDAKRIVGSGPYMSPEQLDGMEVDAQTDLYACGVVLFEILTGKRPAGAEMPSELNPSVPKEFDEVFRRAYARKERRFASAEEFYKAIRGAASGSSPNPASLPSPGVSRHVVIGAFVAAAVAITIAVPLILYFSRTATEPALPNGDQPAAQNRALLAGNSTTAGVTPAGSMDVNGYRLVKAVWYVPGGNNKPAIDVTERIKPILQDNTGDVQASTKLFSDPQWGPHKELRIDYLRPNGLPATITVPEYSNIPKFDLPWDIPAGQPKSPAQHGALLAGNMPAFAVVLDLSTSNISDWLITGGGAVDAPANLYSAATNPGDPLPVDGISVYGSTGTFVKGGSDAQFNGFWFADARFQLPSNASSVSLVFSNLYGDDRVVLELNGKILGDFFLNGSEKNPPLTGTGVMSFSSAPHDVPFTFTGKNSGTVTSGFILGGENDLRLVVNNTGQAVLNAPTINGGSTHAELTALVSYSVAGRTGGSP